MARASLVVRRMRPGRRRRDSHGLRASRVFGLTRQVRGVRQPPLREPVPGSTLLLLGRRAQGPVDVLGASRDVVPTAGDAEHGDRMAGVYPALRASSGGADRAWTADQMLSVDADRRRREPRGRVDRTIQRLRRRRRYWRSG